jgi:methylmalonyl-CoA/ethylmalonyl-CoA epimerase
MITDTSVDPQPLVFGHHHIGFLVKDIALAVRDFNTRLGYSVESDVIEDPVQTAFVQFLRQPGIPVWIELITPNGPDSKLANALHKGGGLHHLCYETDDIEGACLHLREQRMFMIAAPTLATAFPGRRIAWFMDRSGFLVELLEQGDGPLSLASLNLK